MSRTVTVTDEFEVTIVVRVTYRANRDTIEVVGVQSVGGEREVDIMAQLPTDTINELHELADERERFHRTNSFDPDGETEND